MATGQARAVTREEFDRLMNSGGGPGGSGDEDGLLSGIFKKWAKKLIGDKLDEFAILEKNKQLTPKEYCAKRDLLSEFERVSENKYAAYRAVKKYSKVLNSPLIREFIH